jgi:hypothetical protein
MVAHAEQLLAEAMQAELQRLNGGTAKLPTTTPPDLSATSADIAEGEHAHVEAETPRAGRAGDQEVLALSSGQAAVRVRQRAPGDLRQPPHEAAPSESATATPMRRPRTRASRERRG